MRSTQRIPANKGVTLAATRAPAVVISDIDLPGTNLAVACARSTRLRRFVRGAPRPLVRNGKVSAEALDEEGLSYEELLAGLRKQGRESPSEVKLAVLEETGQISVIEKD